MFLLIDRPPRQSDLASKSRSFEEKRIPTGKNQPTTEGKYSHNDWLADWCGEYVHASWVFRVECGSPLNPSAALSLCTLQLRSHRVAALLLP